MRREDVRAILDAAQALTYREWCQIRDAIEQEYDAIHRAARMTPEAMQSAQRIIDQANDWYEGGPAQEQTALRL